MARFEAAERALYRGPLSSLLRECSRGGMPQLDGCPSGSCTSALGLDKGAEWARFDSQSRATRALGPQATRPASAQVKDRPVAPQELSRPQRIAFVLSVRHPFPMTSHAECVALLEKVGSDLR